ncbi:Dynein heavy chain 10 axonemal, partial [Biomphalaria glabrata]
ATQKYLSVAKNMRKYEENLFHLWHDHAERLVPQFLRATLLVRINYTVTASVPEGIRKHSISSMLNAPA